MSTPRRRWEVKFPSDQGHQVESSSDSQEAKRSSQRERRDRALLASMLSGAVAKILMSVFSLASIAVSVRAVGSAQFGVVAALSTLSGLMAFADFGIGSGLMTFLATATARHDVRRARAMISTAAFATSALGLVVASIGLGLTFVLPWRTILGAPNSSDSTLHSTVAIFVVFTGLAIPAGLGQRTLTGHQRGFAANMWLLVASVASLCATVAVAAEGAPLWYFVLSMTGVPVMIALIQTIFLFRNDYYRLRPTLRYVTKDAFGSLAGVSSLYFGLNIAVALAYQSDVVVIASTLGASAAGVFSVALRMFTLINGSLSGASQQMWTAMAEALARGDGEWVRSRLIRVLLGTAAVSVPACATLALVGRTIARVWVGDSLVPPWGLLAAMAAWTIYALAMNQISLFLNAAQVVGAQLVSAIGMTIANLFLSIALTRHIGVSGPVLGSLIAHVIFTGFPSVILARKALNRITPLAERPKESHLQVA